MAISHEPQLRLLAQAANPAATFRLLAERIPQLVWTASCDGGMDYANQRWIEYCGLSQESIPNSLWKQVVHPDDRAAVYDNWTSAVANSSCFERELRLRRYDGEYRWFQLRAEPILDLEGRSICWFGICTDIHEQRQGRERSEERFLRLVDAGLNLGGNDRQRLDRAMDVASTDAEAAVELRERLAVIEGVLEGTDELIAAQDCDFRYVYFNRAYKSVFETLWETELRIGTSMLAALRDWPEELSKAKAIWGRAHAGESFRSTMAFGPSESLRRHFELAFHPLLNESGEQMGAAHIIRDVTAQVNTQRALEESEERFRRLAEAMPQLVWIARRDGVITYYNSQRHRFDGIARNDDGTWYWQPAIHPEDFEATLDKWQWSLDTGEPYQCEHRVRMANGEMRWHLSRAYLADAADSPAWFGTTTDIHDLKVAQDSSRESEERFRVMADGLPLPVWVHDARGAQQFVNQTFCSYFGVSPDEMQEVNWRTLTHPDAGEDYSNRFFKCLRERRPFHGQVRVRRGDGQWRWIESWAHPRLSASGDFLGMVGVSADITERRKTEELIRLRSEAASVLFSSDNPEDMLRGVFEKIAPQLGLDAYFNFELVAGKQELRLASSWGLSDEVVRSLQRMEFSGSLCGAVALSGQPVVGRCIQQSDDPRVRIAKSLGIRSIACNPLHTGNELLGTLSFASCSRDDFDAAELEFLESICRYVAAAYERVRLLNRLQLTDRRKDEFLATLAHELRNPLAPIRSGLEVIRLAADSPDVVAETRKTMERQVSHLVALVDDLLDVSRISNGKFQLRSECVNISDVVDDAIKMCRPLLENAGHRLHLAPVQQPMFIGGDPHRVAQVLLNIINNAAKYTPSGGNIWITTDVDEGFAVIAVKDDGIGIAKENLHQVFELFTQIEKPDGSGYTGLGLGLALVKTIVDMHGGSITVASDGAGGGATFTVRLPLAEPAAIPVDSIRPSDPSLATVSSTSKRVLVVDDNVAAAKTLCMVIRKLGHSVCSADNGEQAVAVAREFLPDLIIMDIGMPVMDGHAAARAIRAEEWGQQMKLIALTGWGQESDLARSKESGFDQHLVKPVEPDRIRRILAETHSCSESPVGED
jgi:PAS domain S-box-containing protein